MDGKNWKKIGLKKCRFFLNPRNKSIKDQKLKVTIEDGRWKPSIYINKDEILEELLGGFNIKKCLLVNST